MKTRMERIDERLELARKTLYKATTKRDKAIADLGRAAVQIKKAQQALARTEKLRVAAKTEERKARKAKPTFNDPIPVV